MRTEEEEVTATSALGRKATGGGRFLYQRLDFRLLGHLERVVYFNPEISNRALELGVPK
jgi:hypothetical protein